MIVVGVRVFQDTVKPILLLSALYHPEYVRIFGMLRMHGRMSNRTVNGIIYIVGLIVVVLAVLSFLGLH